jgi:branched-chain amino acid aminotransferase
VILSRIPAVIDGYDDAIMLDDRGKVSEASGACFFLLRDGVISTPPITAGILESITRTIIINLIKDNFDIPIIERQIDRTELYLSDEAFLCGTGEEITAVTSIDRLPLGNGIPGPIFLELEELYNNIVRGLDSQGEEWRYPVYSS